MAVPESLLIFGASARAAAFSALRAGLRPWCADLFGDADLQACCPTVSLPPGSYPHGFVEASLQGPAGPWMYTGGLENCPDLVRQLSLTRPLWGNGPSVLRLVRSPRAVQALLRAAAVPCPEIHLPGDDLPREGRWLVKPERGAGGAGIRFWNGESSFPPGKDVYLQKFIEGMPCAAIFTGDGSRARLLGVTLQLTGAYWLHARPFAYCGSIGPRALSSPLRASLEHVGNVLVGGSGLRGLFGVDFILADGVPWPVEVNPRYTASVEVLEYALGLSALGAHREVFEPLSSPAAWEQPQSGALPVVGKAILFARAGVLFPVEGPWTSTLAQIPERLSTGRLWELPAFADIPKAGQRIEAGRPILSLFTCAASIPACENNLRQMAADLDRWLKKT